MIVPPETTQRKLEYIEEVGVLMESMGFARMWGRVFGALLVADPPEQTAEELATTLQASRGSISGATRMLEGAGLIERIAKPGERKDYFRNRPNAWVEIFRKRTAAIRAFRQVAERGLDVVDSDDPDVLRGLTDMRDYFTYLEREFPHFLERWQRDLEARPEERR